MGRGKLRRLRVETASVADGALAAVSRSSPVVRERLFQNSTEFLDVMELFIGRPTGLWLWPGCSAAFSVRGAAAQVLEQPRPDHPERGPSRALGVWRLVLRWS